METNGFFDEEDTTDLAQLDSDFEKAPVEQRDSDSIEDGKYQVRVDKVELTRSHSSGNRMLKWKLRILGPKHGNRILWKNSLIVSADNLKWLKTDLSICGLKITKLSELPAHLGALIDVCLEISKSTKGENQNIYFNRRIQVSEDIGPLGSDGVPLF